MIPLELERAFENRKQKLLEWVHVHQLRQIQWEATLRCDMACSHCGSSCVTGSTHHDELSEDEIIRTFDTIAHDFDPNSIELVSITGGEPLLRPDLPRIISRLSSIGFNHISVQTNGNALVSDRSLADCLVTSGLSGIGISIDGLRDSHDRQRNRKGHFDQLCRLVEWLVGTKELYVSVTTVITKLNIDDLNGLAEIIQDLRPHRWRLIEVQPIGRAHSNSSLLLSPDEYFKLVQFVLDKNANAAMENLEFRPKVELGCTGWMGTELEGLARPYIWHCQAGIGTLGIWNDGTIGGCTDIDHGFGEGNVKTDLISDRWENGFQRYRDWSSRRNGVCVSCDQWDWCHGGGMHLRTSQNELLHCPYLIYQLARSRIEELSRD